MTLAIFDNDTITLRKIDFAFSADLEELSAKELRDQLLAKYPVEPEATPVAGPLHEVTLAEARPGDIATFTNSVGGTKYVCTLKTDDGDLLADKWLTANVMSFVWTIRTSAGKQAAGMTNLHIWRWDGVEKAVELPGQPTVAGWYVTATSDQVLYNDGDPCANWSRPHGANWSTGSSYEDWDVVVRDLGPEQLPLKFISKKEN